MTHALPPTAGTSWWKQILALEPVAVQAAVRAVLLLVAAVLAGFGLNLPDTIEPWLLGVVGAFYVAVEAVTTMLARRRATPTARVVQVVEPDGTVVAGPASPLADGTPLTPADVEAAVLDGLDTAQQAGELDDPDAGLIDAGARVTRSLAARGITPAA